MAAELTPSQQEMYRDMGWDLEAAMDTVFNKWWERAEKLGVSGNRALLRRLADMYELGDEFIEWIEGGD